MLYKVERFCYVMANTLLLQKIQTSVFQNTRKRLLQRWKLLLIRYHEKCTGINNICMENRTFQKYNTNRSRIFYWHTEKNDVAKILHKRCSAELFNSNLLQTKVSTKILKRTIFTSVCQSNRWCAGKPFGNPLQDLQQYLSVPVLDPKDYVFKVSDSEINDGQKLFHAQEGQLTQASRGVVYLKDLPPAKLPEVCFIGRSNVGKSSLIKALFYDPLDVKISISGKPGHTRSLKFYNIAKSFSLVDMPGYGYNMPEYFVESVEEYMKIRSTLQRVFLLIDASVGLTKTDERGIEMLEECGKPYVAVLTKIDKASHQRIMTNFLKFNEMKAELMHCCFPQPFLVSAHLGAGLPLLRAFIAHITGNLQVKGE